jgi:hypothetical protein
MEDFLVDVNASIRLSIIRLFVTLLLFGAALSLAGSAESGIPVIVSPYGIVMKIEVVFEGDSLTAEEVYPNYVAGALNLASGNNRSNHYDNVARSGEAVSPNMLNDGPAQVDSKYSASKYKNIAVLWGGTNDIFQDDAQTVRLEKRQDSRQWLLQSSQGKHQYSSRIRERKANGKFHAACE